MGKQMQKRVNNTQITLIQQGVKPRFDQGFWVHESESVRSKNLHLLNSKNKNSATTLLQGEFHRYYPKENENNLSFLENYLKI